MLIAFYLAAAIALASTVMVITRKEAVHALLYLVVSLLAAAVVFFVLGAPFVAALEVIIYAGAIMVLFVFVVMLLNIGPGAAAAETRLLRPGMWIGPSLLALALVIELLVLLENGPTGSGAAQVPPRAVGGALFGPYLIAVELASFLLLAGLVGAYHLGRRDSGGRRA